VQPIPPTQAAQEEWGKWISYAEEMLIYFTSPSYNSSGIKNLPKLPEMPIVILNFKRSNKLPGTISNLYEQSPVSDTAKEWKVFIEPEQFIDSFE
jgi:hypothetical protein